jgi:ABC-type transporter Mla MlaB component
MTVRIDTVLQSPAQAVLRVAGRLADHEADLLDYLIAQTLAQVSAVTVDLQSVTLLDNDAVAVLRRWVVPPAGQPSRVTLRLRQGKPFIRLLLETHGIPVH